jgi:hypothetical protein
LTCLCVKLFEGHVARLCKLIKLRARRCKSSADGSIRESLLNATVWLIIDLARYKQLHWCNFIEPKASIVKHSNSPICILNSLSQIVCFSSDDSSGELLSSFILYRGWRYIYRCPIRIINCLTPITIVSGINVDQYELGYNEITIETSISKLSYSLIEEVLNLSIVLSISNTSLQSYGLLEISCCVRGRWVINDRLTIIPSGDVGVVREIEA